MSTGWSADRPTPLETDNKQTARKIRSKLCLPCDVSDGTHILDRTSGSVHRTIAFMQRFPSRAPGQDTPLAIGSNNMLTKCDRFTLVAVFDVRRMPHVRFAMDPDARLCLG